MSALRNPILDNEKKSSEDVDGYLNRNDTFTVPRTDTFARNDTFGPAGVNRAQTFDQTNPRRMSSRFGGITRTLTNAFDPDGEFTKKAIENYVEHGSPAQEGELPLPAGFARKAKFWKIVFLGSVLGIFIALAASLFVNMIDNIPEKYATCDFDHDSSCGGFYKGEKYWIAISGGAGLGIGIFRYVTKFPRSLPGIFKEIEDMHVDWRWSIHTYLISMASLCAGATLGPEQALGNLAGGMGTFVVEHIPHPEWWFEEQAYKDLFILGSMASALGALLNTPLLGTSMLHELGDPPKTFMESSIYFSIVGSISFAMYYSMATNTWIDHASDSTAKLSGEWLHNGGYQNWMVVTATLIGFVSAGICFMCILSLGIFRQVFNRIRQRLSFNKALEEIVPPTIGGIVLGTVNWALPATITSGSLVFTYLFKFGLNGDISKNLLLCTGFARVFLFGVCTQCGFIGGIIFPLLTIGAISGILCHLYFEELDPIFCVTCFMNAIPMTIVPMPFTFTCLIIFLFFLGYYQGIPVFIAGITAYTILCGSGLFKKIAMTAQEQQRRDELAKQQKEAEAAGGKKIGSISEGDSESVSSTKGTTIEQITSKKIKEKKEAEEFAVNAYLSNKRNGPSSVDGADNAL